MKAHHRHVFIRRGGKRHFSWASLVEWLLWMCKALTLGSVLNTETKGKKEGGGGVRGMGRDEGDGEG